jgi:hypothetical protein
MEKYSNGLYSLFSTQLLWKLWKFRSNYDYHGILTLIKNSQFNIRQFKETNPKYYLPARYNTFNFSLPHIYGLLDQMMKRMTKKWVAAKMPELKETDIDTIIGLYLNSQHCREY